MARFVGDGSACLGRRVVVGNQRRSGGKAEPDRFIGAGKLRVIVKASELPRAIFPNVVVLFHASFPARGPAVASEHRDFRPSPLRAFSIIGERYNGRQKYLVMDAAFWQPLLTPTVSRGEVFCDSGAALDYLIAKYSLSFFRKKRGHLIPEPELGVLLIKNLQALYIAD